MSLDQRLRAFASLGDFLSQFEKADTPRSNHPANQDFYDAFAMQIKRSKESNGWFTEDNVRHSLYSWSKILTESNLNSWIKPYNLSDIAEKKIGIITAGNIPLVGFHDFLSVLVSGHSVEVKQSSSDKYLLPLIAHFLKAQSEAFSSAIHFAQDQLSNFDAVIATGSNNTAKHFEYYFGKYPNLIRRNRNSIAVLDGTESPEELKGLGEDVFRYFGLGCRSVAKLFVPKGYDFDLFFKEIFSYKDLIDYDKYRNNYDYNKAVYLMSQFKLLENGFLMLKEDPNYASPIATLFYEYYDSSDALQEKLQQDQEQIQCIVGQKASNSAYISFGQTQKPGLTDYADGVDTMAFLSNL